MIGWLALPILCLHDLLLTGNPLWWLSVAPHAVELNHGRARSLPGVLVMSAGHVRGMWPLAIEAVAGGLILLTRPAWIPVVGLVALGPLVIVYTWALAVRHVNVLSHYYHPADMAAVLGARNSVAAGLASAPARLGAR